MFRPLRKAAKAVARYVFLRIAMLCVLLYSLVACTDATKAPPPVPAQCEAACFVPCTTSGIAWTADPSSPEAYDALGEQVVQPLAERVLTCDVRRCACHQCLLRAQDNGVLVGVPPLPATCPIP